MEKFVKTYSDLPNSFVEDFFHIAKENYDDDDIVIDFNIVVKWLDVRKDHLKRLLISKFELNYDYVIKKIKINNNGRGSNYHDEILITPNCFKELCMISQTGKAKQVRKYYLTIEKLIKKYRIAIEMKYQKQLKLYKYNQKEKIDIKSGVLYILPAQNVHDEEMSLYKIGKSNYIKGRLNTYNSGNANDIEPLFIIQVDDVDTVENCVKTFAKKFKYRKNKEIYEADLDMLKVVLSVCDQITNSFKKILMSGDRKLLKKKWKLMEKSKKLFLAVHTD